jgi:hypothetical protein
LSSKICPCGGMVDTSDLGSDAEGCESSSLSGGTNNTIINIKIFGLLNKSKYL